MPLENLFAMLASSTSRCTGQRGLKAGGEMSPRGGEGGGRGTVVEPASLSNLFLRHEIEKRLRAVWGTALNFTSISVLKVTQLRRKGKKVTEPARSPMSDGGGEK